MQHTPRLWWCCVLVLSLATFDARADRLILKDGRVIEGRVIKRTEGEVHINVKKGGASLRLAYKTSEVKEIVDEEEEDAAKPAIGKKGEGQSKVPSSQPATTPAAAAKSGPTYLVAPIRGAIGLYATTELLKTYISIARAQQPDMFILEIDTGGGSVREVGAMIDLLQAAKDLKPIAYVRNAHSAGAMLAMSCRQIVMAPDASIGGAVIYSTTPWGTPQNIEEKMQSIYRAQFRAAAEAAGQEPLLIEGMMRTDVVLSRTGAGPGTKVIEGSPAGSALVKPRGRILTLTASEAVACYLADDIADRPEGCAVALGLQTGGTASRAATDAFFAHRKAIDEAAKRYASALGRANEAYARAIDNDPSSRSYRVDSASGEFRGKAKQEWKERSDACVKSLKECKTAISAARTVLKARPKIAMHPNVADKMYDPVALFEISKELEVLAKKVRADRKRKGITG